MKRVLATALIGLSCAAHAQSFNDLSMKQKHSFCVTMGTFVRNIATQHRAGKTMTEINESIVAFTEDESAARMMVSIAAVTIEDLTEVPSRTPKQAEAIVYKACMGRPM